MEEKSDPIPLVVAVSGASGAVYARELLRRLAARNVPVHLCISGAGFRVIQEELGVVLDERKPDLGKLLDMGGSDRVTRGRRIVPLPFSAAVRRAAHTTLRYFHRADIGAPACSGSFRTRGMVVVPCSMGRLASIATGLSRDFIDRAADVTLKEGRRLVLVPRETPLHLIHIKNMLGAAQAGATIVPAMPGFYQHPKSVDDLVGFLVDRILQQFES